MKAAVSPPIRLITGTMATEPPPLTDKVAAMLLTLWCAAALTARPRTCNLVSSRLKALVRGAPMLPTSGALASSPLLTSTVLPASAPRASTSVAAPVTAALVTPSIWLNTADTPRLPLPPTAMAPAKTDAWSLLKASTPILLAALTLAPSLMKALAFLATMLVTTEPASAPVPAAAPAAALVLMVLAESAETSKSLTARPALLLFLPVTLACAVCAWPGVTPIRLTASAAPTAAVPPAAAVPASESMLAASCAVTRTVALPPSTCAFESVAKVWLSMRLLEAEPPRPPLPPSAPATEPDVIAAVLSPATVTARAPCTALSSTRAVTAVAILLSATAAPMPASLPPATAPASDSMRDSSVALMVVVALAPVNVRSEAVMAAPATLPEPVPIQFSVTEPDTPRSLTPTPTEIAALRMFESSAPVTLSVLACVTLEASSVARAPLSMLLNEKAPPTPDFMPSTAAPLPDKMADLSAALMVTAFPLEAPPAVPLSSALWPTVASVWLAMKLSASAAPTASPLEPTPLTASDLMSAPESALTASALAAWMVA